jgi:hypothetical protein
MAAKSIYSKYLIILGFIFAFHSAYAVSKSTFYLIKNLR